MRQAWKELMFTDEDLAAKQVRDPVAPAKRSEAALKKVQTHTLEDPPCQTSCRSIMIAEPPQRSAIYDQKSSFH